MCTACAKVCLAQSVGAGTPIRNRLSLSSCKPQLIAVEGSLDEDEECEDGWFGDDYVRLL